MQECGELECEWEWGDDGVEDINDLSRDRGCWISEASVVVSWTRVREANKRL